jgi:TolB protein
MKKIFCTLALCVTLAVHAVEQVALEEVNARQFKKMSILIGLLKADKDATVVSEQVKKDLEFTGQFSVDIETVDALSSKNQVRQWFEKGYPLVVYLQPSSSGYEWHLYDTTTANMINGKKVAKLGSSKRGWAHALADELWPALTGTPGFFSTKVVYGKEVCRRGRNCKKYIYIRDATDTEGGSEELLVASPTISVSPRWNRDLQNPMVLYSEYTKTNVRLIAVNMKGKRKVVSDFEGVNMQVSYSPEGKEVVYCLSRAPHASHRPHLTSQLYHYFFDPYSQQACFKRLTSNAGNNFAPCWGPDNTLFFASDASKNGQPNICWYDFKNKKTAWLTQDGYATSPSYNPSSNKLVYTKMVNKIMQLFEFDVTTQQHRQLTSDPSNKDDCSWSPCGNLISYSAEVKGKSRLAVFNLLTKEQLFITSEGEDCSYPSWSPKYAQMPVIA